MLKRFLIALAVLLAIVAVIFYYKLGGTKPLTFSLTVHPAVYVTGQYFEGKYNDPKIEKLFFEAREKAARTTGAALTVVNYQDSNEKDVIRQFIGSGTMTGPEDIPEDLAVRIFPGHKAVVTTIDAHNFVMPTAETVLTQAKEFAKEGGYELDTLSLETYISERELRISFPVKE